MNALHISPEQESAVAVDDHQHLMSVLEPALQAMLDVAGLHPMVAPSGRTQYRSESEIADEVQALASSLLADGIEASAAAIAQDCAMEARRLAALFEAVAQLIARREAMN